MRVLFLAQSCTAALPPLAVLLGSGHETLSIVLAGKPRRGMGDIQRLAEDAGIPVVWAPSTDAAASSLRDAAPDVAVAACFPWRLPEPVTKIPPLGMLNIHPSLLPAGRGAEPVFWTLRRGERVTGVTVHRMDAGLDTGPIVAQVELPVAAGIRAPDLENELMTLGGTLVVEALPALEAGTLHLRPQPTDGVSHAPGPSPADWTMPTSLPAAWAWRFARGVAPLGGPLAVIAGGAVIPVRDALDWSPHEHGAERVIDEGDGTVRVRFNPGWVRFQKAPS